MGIVGLLTLGPSSPNLLLWWLARFYKLDDKMMQRIQREAVHASAAGAFRDAFAAKRRSGKGLKEDAKYDPFLNTRILIYGAHYSDPDIVRVGDDFFTVSSSFNHVPALPILHSTDLVNWTIINHVMDELPLPGYDRYQPGKGVWAPSIRWHDGKLWVCFSTPDEGIFICHTEDPWG